jgi:uncharacterized protein YndB with AHSA1/START domain
MPVIERRATIAAPPDRVFAYLQDPVRRPMWDTMVDLCRLEAADAPAAGVRMHLRGRRKAPSWVGEYVEYDQPRRSVVRMVGGVGMPFSDFRQTITVGRAGDGSEVVLRIDYRARGLFALLEPVTVRRRLRRAVGDSLRRLEAEVG